MPSFKGQLSDKQIADVDRLRRHEVRRRPERLSRSFPQRISPATFASSRPTSTARWSRQDVVLRPRTIAALQRAHAAGLPVIVVTGRMVQSVRQALEPAGLAAPVIGYQGAVVADERRPWLRHEPIPLELAREAIAALADEGYSPNVYVDDELYVARVTPRRGRTRTSRTSTIHVVGALLDWLDEPPTKLVMRRRPGRARRARAADEGAVRRPALHREVAAALPRVRAGRRDEGRRAGLPRRAARLHAGARRSRSATARTTWSSSSGPATGSRSRTRTSA